MPNQALKSLPEATGGVPVEIWSAPRGPIANLAHGFGKKVVTRRRFFRFRFRYLEDHRNREESRSMGDRMGMTLWLCQQFANLKMAQSK